LLLTCATRVSKMLPIGKALGLLSGLYRYKLKLSYSAWKVFSVFTHSAMWTYGGGGGRIIAKVVEIVGLCGTDGREEECLQS
jgi:hypothetical protein